MITDLLRRLQGRPTTDAPFTDPATPGAKDVELTYDALIELHLQYAFGCPAGVSAQAGLGGPVLAQLESIASRMDVRRLPRLPAVLRNALGVLQSGRDLTLADVRALDLAAADALAHSARRENVAVDPGSPASTYCALLAHSLGPILGPGAGVSRCAPVEHLWTLTLQRVRLCATMSAGSTTGGETLLTAALASAGSAMLLRMAPVAALAQAASDPLFAAALRRIAGPLGLRAAAHWHVPQAVLDALSALDTGAIEPGTLAHTVLQADRLAMTGILSVAGRLPEPVVA